MPETCLKKENVQQKNKRWHRQAYKQSVIGLHGKGFPDTNCEVACSEHSAVFLKSMPFLEAFSKTLQTKLLMCSALSAHVRGR
jgi:hypothetical protein